MTKLDSQLVCFFLPLSNQNSLSFNGRFNLFTFPEIPSKCVVVYFLYSICNVLDFPILSILSTIGFIEVSLSIFSL